MKLVILNLWKANKISDIAALKRVSADLILIKVGQGKVIDDLFEENFKLLTDPEKQGNRKYWAINTLPITLPCK